MEHIEIYMTTKKQKSSRILWNLLGVLICSQGLLESIFLPLPPYLEKGGAWQFLTNTSLLVSCTCMACIMMMCVSERYMGIHKHTKGLVYMVECLCCNLEFIVSVTYWSIILLMPGMLNGKSFDVSWNLDLKIHLFPYLFILMDLVLFSDNFDKLRYIESFSLLVTFLGSYWSFIEFNTLYWKKDGITRFPYPFLNNCTLAYRLSFLAVFVGLGLTNVILLDYLVRYRRIRLMKTD